MRSQLRLGRDPSVRAAVALALFFVVGADACSSTSSEDFGGTADGGRSDSASGQGSTPSSDAASEGSPSPPAVDAHVDTDASAACTAHCVGKTCGDDGCKGSCGGCPPSQLFTAAQTCAAPPSTSGIVVDVSSQGTAISPAIYGVALNNDDSMQIAALNRWGGDATSSYNWQIGVSNAGTDWNCANYTDLFTAPTPDTSLHTSSDQFVRYDINRHADSLMTIPISGWVASRATPNPSTPDCAGGTRIATCCQTLGTSEERLVDQGSAVLDTSFMGAWVTHLVATFGSAAAGGVKYYQLDNEPDNWQFLRTDVYPSLYPPGGSCEPFYATNASIGTSLNQDFINRTMGYAKVVKAADPSAAVLFMSTESPDDLVAIPNVECGAPAGPYTVANSLTTALLKLAAAGEAAGGGRLLDCVDMHYPFPGQGLGDTKALWDATSTSVVPHVQGWINSTYPGTGICVSEYTVTNDGTDGSTPDPSSAAQEADVLGMYGRLGYRVAAYWSTLVVGTTHLPIYNAMAMYRNYDGKGGQFGSYSVGTASPNAGVNVYAASDSPSNPTKVWVMLVNVSGAAQNNLSITLRNFTPTGQAQVYRTSGGAPALGTAVSVTNGSITGISLPSNAVALLAMSR